MVARGLAFHLVRAAQFRRVDAVQAQLLAAHPDTKAEVNVRCASVAVVNGGDVGAILEELRGRRSGGSWRGHCGSVEN